MTCSVQNNLGLGQSQMVGSFKVPAIRVPVLEPVAYKSWNNSNSQTFQQGNDWIAPNLGSDPFQKVSSEVNNVPVDNLMDHFSTKLVTYTNTAYINNIIVAKGGTPSNLWNEGEELYNRLYGEVPVAFEQFPNPYVKPRFDRVIVAQGEGDHNGSDAEWTSNWAGLRESLIEADYVKETTPFYFCAPAFEGALSNRYDAVLNVSNTIDSSCVGIDSRFISVGDDNIHFTGQGRRQLAHRIIINALSNPNDNLQAKG